VTSTDIVIKGTGELATPDSINAYLSRIVEQLPDQDEGDAYGILAQIINSEGIDDIDSPWQSAGMKKYNGYAVEIRSIKKMPSEIPGGLAWYLLCEGIVMESGEYKAFTTSASAVLAQLLVVWDRGLFPYQCYIRIAKKPTKKGFYPMHLETYRGGALVDLEGEATATAHHIPASRGNARPGRRAEAPFDPQTAADAQASDERRTAQSAQ
jgi:hypothetical protein